MLSSVLPTTKKGRRLLDGYSAVASEEEHGGLLWNRDSFLPLVPCTWLKLQGTLLLILNEIMK